MATVVASRATIFTDTALERHPYFSWGAVFAGAVAGAMVTFMLIAIGAGLGLMFIGPVNEAKPVTTILTAGGIYFFAVEAFGFAVGGYLAGRLCGPVLQSRDEEIFRSGVHGLVVWALVSAAGMIALTIGAAVATAAAGGLAAMLGMSPAGGDDSEGGPALAAYWADTLLRVTPAGAPVTAPTTAPLPNVIPGMPPSSAPVETAPLPPSESAPAPTEDMTVTPPDNGGGAPAPSDESVPAPGDESAPPDEPMPPPSPSPAVYVPGGDLRGLLHTVQLGTVSVTDPADAPRHAGPATREEIARVLTANMLALDKMPAEDRRYIEETVAAQTGVSTSDARRRLDGLTARMKAEQTKAAEAARKAGAYVHIWTGLALFFGLLVATAAAVLARLEDEEKRDEVVVTTSRVEPAVPPV